LVGRSVVRGQQVTKGYEVVKNIEKYGTEPFGKPIAEIVIKDCGKL
jgi:hypothetical protein